MVRGGDREKNPEQREGKWEGGGTARYRAENGQVGLQPEGGEACGESTR